MLFFGAYLTRAIKSAVFFITGAYGQLTWVNRPKTRYMDHFSHLMENSLHLRCKK